MVQVNTSLALRLKKCQQQKDGYINFCGSAMSVLPNVLMRV